MKVARLLALGLAVAAASAGAQMHDSSMQVNVVQSYEYIQSTDAGTTPMVNSVAGATPVSWTPQPAPPPRWGPYPRR